MLWGRNVFRLLPHPADHVGRSRRVARLSACVDSWWIRTQSTDMYPPHAGRLCFGADYNPEQWPPDVWREDVALMRAAGVTMVTVGVFSWSWLEPAQGRYEFGWLDEVLGLLVDGGIAVDLATATASPPPWFSHAYPDSLPVDRDGR